ncbi:unnamed protein product, partial [Phaeothamnion confervicola]
RRSSGVQEKDSLGSVSSSVQHIRLALSSRPTPCGQSLSLDGKRLSFKLERIFANLESFLLRNRIQARVGDGSGQTSVAVKIVSMHADSTCRAAKAAAMTLACNAVCFAATENRKRQWPGADSERGGKGRSALAAAHRKCARLPSLRRRRRVLLPFPWRQPLLPRHVERNRDRFGRGLLSATGSGGRCVASDYAVVLCGTGIAKAADDRGGAGSNNGGSCGNGSSSTSQNRAGGSRDRKGRAGGGAGADCGG